MHAEAEQMRRELVIVHPELLERDAARVYKEMGQALRLIPDNAIWMVAAHEIAVYALHRDILFIAGQHPTEARVVLSSMRLVASELEVTLEWEEGEPNEDLTAILRVMRWTFRHQGAEDEPWQQIDGTVSTDSAGLETPDAREEFARELAYFAGWEALD